MSKNFLSEYTDRSEPSREDPREVAERLGVPLLGGGDQDRMTETAVSKPVGVCAKCGLVLHQTMHYVCSNGGCPTGLGGRVTLNADSRRGIDE